MTYAETCRLPRDIEPWFQGGLEIRQSRIHGLGVFTTTELSKGTVIMRLGGNLFHLSLRKAAEVVPSTAIPVADQVVLGEPAGGEKDYSDYLNHSCDPNLGFKDALSLVALKDISPECEITIDYAFWECDSNWHLKAPCNCNTAACRKDVDGKYWMMVSPTEPTANYFAPFLRRRILLRSLRPHEETTK